MKTKHKTNTFALACAVLTSTSAVQAQTQYTWDGDTNSAFATTGNWTSALAAPTGGTSVSRLNVLNGTNNALTYTSAQGTTIYSGGTGRALVIASTSAGGSMIISGGTFDSRNSDNDLMVNGALAGSLTISGTGNYINTNGGGTIFFNGFNAGGVAGANATLNVSGGSFTTGTLQAGQSAGIGAGGLISTVNLDGGVLAANSIREGGAALAAGDAARALITSTFNFNGGTLRARVDGTIMPAVQGIDNVIVKAGGAIVDTNGFNTAIERPLTAGAPSGGFEKKGTGVLTLSAVNTYTGTSLVSAGNLRLNGSTHTSSAFTVSSSATLSGNGTVGGSLELNGTVAPGQGIIDYQDLKVTGSVTLNSGSMFQFNLLNSSINDKLSITGDLIKGTDGVYNFDFMGSTAAVGTKFTLFTFANLSGLADTNFSFSNFGGSPASGSAGFKFEDHSLTWTAVPEASNLLIGGLVGLGLMARRRKQA